ncbi:MAG: 30S ribosomal protein S7 [Verrucomicrobia bacterium]|nr:30S ribosomal protein S7 [Verrucomicrobiota bacterium]
MARRRRHEARPIHADPVYESPLVGRMIGYVLRRGKLSTASRLVYNAIKKANEGGSGGDPLAVVNRAIDNVKPRLEVKSRRVGGATYQVPVETTPERQLSLALRAQEIRDAAAGQGNAVKKRDETHRMAQANRAFAHLRW